ncbi:MAG: AraC family transcriptional regulator [Succinivibrio sp.]|nr:AraC family transcriptional regulator [Succinivibrio sp.]
MIPLSNAYHENFTRGSVDFPFDYHYISPSHPRFIMPFHYHNDFEIIRVLKGGLSIHLNERSYYLKENDYLFINGGVVHGGEPDDQETRYECVVFNLEQIFDQNRPDFGWLKELLNHKMHFEEFYAHEDEAEICWHFDQFLKSILPSSSHGRIGALQHNAALAYGRLLTLLGTLIAKHRYQQTPLKMSSCYQKHLNKSSKLFRYIYDNFAKDITLQDMADAVDLNPKYFCRFFKELTSMRPMDYLNRFRIDCAAIQLRTSVDSINQIADACGFKDPCYFTKMFKRYKQVSPREYRHQAELAAHAEQEQSPEQLKTSG